MRFILQVIILQTISLIFINICYSASYFYSKEESESILEYISPKSNIYKVSGILYLDDNNWIIWINDKPYNSTGLKEEFSIDEVYEDKVTLTLKNGQTIVLTIEC